MSTPPDRYRALRGGGRVVADVFAVAPAAAQQQAPAPAGAEPEFLTRYNFHLTAAALDIDDPRFKWDTHFGGELDLLDYVAGRSSIIVDYEAVLGDQLRPFDPNQGNYTLEASSSVPWGKTEIVGFFHHVSRHLGDRPKVFRDCLERRSAPARCAGIHRRRPTSTIAWRLGRVVAAYVDYVVDRRRRRDGASVHDQHVGVLRARLRRA